MPRLLAAIMLTVTGLICLGFSSDDRSKPVAICMALQSIRAGDMIPVVITGVYTGSYLYDPAELSCGADIQPQTCVEFPRDLAGTEDIQARLEEDGRVKVTFRGTLHGPRVVSELVNRSLPARELMFARMAEANNRRYCGNLFGTKLVVDSILESSSVPEDVPWPGIRADPKRKPVPVRMELPTYPPRASRLPYEGIVHVAVSINSGLVDSVEVLFGDPLLTSEVVRNVKTWQFEKGVNTEFVVKYEFVLENYHQTGTENVTLEMRLPSYIRVVGPRVIY